MKRFTVYSNLPDGGNVGYGEPGWVNHAAGIYGFLQSGLQLQFERKTPGTAAYIVVDVTAGSYNAAMRLSFRYSDIVYCDITEIVRCGITRNMTAAGSIMAQGVAGDIVLTEYDSTDTVIGDTRIADITFCDALALPYQPASPFAPSCPDRLRMPAAAQYASLEQVTVRAAAAYNNSTTVVTVKLASGTVDYTASLPNVSAPAQIGLKPTSAFVEVAGHSIRIERESCTSDKIFVTWWSCQDGGYKSYLCDIVSKGGAVDSRTRYNAGFEFGDTVEASPSLTVSFPNLTVNDWQYCRDILYSGEVRVWEPETTLPGSYAELIGRRAVVSGEAGEWKTNDTKDLEISLTFENVTML